MNDSAAIDMQKLLQEPYWSLDQIIGIAIDYKFPDLNLTKNENEVKEFSAEILNDVIQAIIEMTIQPVDLGKYSSWNGPYTYYYEQIKSVEWILSIYLMAYVSQKMLNHNFPAEIEIFKKDFGYDFHFIYQDVIFSVTFVLVAMIFLGWWGVLGYQMIRKKICKTPQDKINYLIFDARIKGITENYFVSDNAIDFLNMKYSMHIPKDPFRVWKEPFLKRSGEIWFIGFMGKRISIRDYVVLEKIAYLLGHPNKDIRSYEFNKPDPSNLGDNQKPNRGQDYDESDHDYLEFKREKAESKKLTKQVAEELLKYRKDDLMEAKECNQTEEILHIISEIKMWEKYINETFTLRGSERPPLDDATKDSDNLKREINRFITTIRKLHPSFAEHLKYIKKEPTFMYRPPDDITWDVRF